MPDKLTSLGFTDRFAQEATLNPDLHPARVIVQYKELYRVATAESEMLAEISGKMRHAAVDTPGMRELGLESANLARTFIDIDELAEQCKFKDCKHENEPGCMVRKAIEDGILTEERLQSYLKLKKEARYEGMNSKQIEKEKISTMFSDFGGIKNARKFAKSKNKEK